MTFNPVALAVNIARAYEICIIGGHLYTIVPDNSQNEPPVLEAQLDNIKFLSKCFGDYYTEDRDEAAIVIEMHNIGSQDIMRALFSVSGTYETIEDIISRGEKIRENNAMPKELPVPSALSLLRTAIDRLNLSIRQVACIYSVAKTTAMMEGSDQIEAHHMAEAIQYQSI